MTTTITTNNPRISSERVFRDLDLNFTLHPVKKDVSTHLNEYAIINAVKNLISTNFYEKPFRPEIGSSVRSLLFENVDPLVASRLERSIEETILNYEPRVSVTNVRAQASPDENLYLVTLTFIIINNPTPITIDFFLERIR
jgi:phage baseplate assembly protein W